MWTASVTSHAPDGADLKSWVVYTDGTRIINEQYICHSLDQIKTTMLQRLSNLVAQDTFVSEVELGLAYTIDDLTPPAMLAPAEQPTPVSTIPASPTDPATALTPNELNFVQAYIRKLLGF